MRPSNGSAAKMKILKTSLVWLAVVGVTALGFAVYGQQTKLRKANFKDAQWCIKQEGGSPRCDDVNIQTLPSEIAEEFTKAKESRKQILAAERAEAEARRARLKQAETELREREELQRLEAAEKFKAEGWWQASSGIYIRWCTPANPCPGSASDHYTSRVWRAMVWCKERACGDIYARMNIESGGAVIGWTNDTAYGDYGQKVILTFGSHLSGKGQIVEFTTRG